VQLERDTMIEVKIPETSAVVKKKDGGNAGT